MDAGIHCIDVMRFLTGDPVHVLEVDSDRHLHKDGIERSADCCLTAAGVTCQIEVRSQASYLSTLTISGTEGQIVVDDFAAIAVIW